MKILITGGMGFIGSATANRLRKDGHDVIVFDNGSTSINPAHLDRNIYLQIGDIRNKENINQIFASFRPDVVMHFAGRINARESVLHPQKYIDNNINGTATCLDACVKHNVRKIMFASTGGCIYGSSLSPSLEESPLNPENPYGITKLTCEKFLKYYYDTHCLEYIALRYANVYGPLQQPFTGCGVIAIFIDDILKNRIINIKGSGHQVRDFVYIDDVVEANMKTLSSNYVGALNIGTGQGTNIKSIADKIKSHSNRHVDTFYGDEEAGDQDISILNCNKARDILNWHALTDIDEGIKKVIEQKQLDQDFSV